MKRSEKLRYENTAGSGAKRVAKIHSVVGLGWFLWLLRFFHSPKVFFLTLTNFPVTYAD